MSSGFLASRHIQCSCPQTGPVSVFHFYSWVFLFNLVDHLQFFFLISQNLIENFITLTERCVLLALLPKIKRRRAIVSACCNELSQGLSSICYHCCWNRCVQCPSISHWDYKGEPINFPDSSSAAMAVVEPLSHHEEQKLEEIYSVLVAKELLKGEAHKD